MKFLKKNTSVILLMIVLASVGSVLAKNPHQKPNKPSFVEIDANGDDKLSAEELEAQYVKRVELMFSKLDQDNNGSISKEEFLNKGEKKEKNIFKAMDTDKDGFVSQTEFDSFRPHRSHKKQQQEQVEQKAEQTAEQKEE